MFSTVVSLSTSDGAGLQSLFMPEFFGVRFLDENLCNYDDYTITITILRLCRDSEQRQAAALFFTCPLK